MGHTTARRRFGVVLAALAIVALGVGCAPDSPSEAPEPPDPCATVQSGAVANVTSNCPPPCPATSVDGTTANVTATCPPECPTAKAANTANSGGGCPEPCPTAPQNGTGANIGQQECPTEPPEECNAETQSGGAGVTTTAHELGQAGPTSFLFEFDALSQPDRFQVFYEGALIHDTGWRGSNSSWTGPDGNPIVIAGPGLGSATVDVPAGASSVITVTVTGQGPGTIWDYRVNCPASAPV